MQIKIRYFDGCPNWITAQERVEEAACLADVSVDTTLDRVTTHEEAVATHFSGSPTILIEGNDPFDGETASFGLTCRRYETPVGVQGAPSVQQLISVLRAVAGGGET